MERETLAILGSMGFLWDFLIRNFEVMLIWDDPDYSVMSEPICHAWRHDEYKYLEHISSIAQGIEQGVCILCSCITKAMKFLTMQLIRSLQCVELHIYSSFAE